MTHTEGQASSRCSKSVCWAACWGQGGAVLCNSGPTHAPLLRMHQPTARPPAPARPFQALPPSRRSSCWALRPRAACRCACTRGCPSGRAWAAARPARRPRHGPSTRSSAAPCPRWAGGWVGGRLAGGGRGGAGWVEGLRPGPFSYPPPASSCSLSCLPVNQSSTCRPAPHHQGTLTHPAPSCPAPPSVPTLPALTPATAPPPSPPPRHQDKLIYAGLASEAAVSGYHADNIAPALMGGFILIR